MQTSVFMIDSGRQLQEQRLYSTYPNNILQGAAPHCHSVFPMCVYAHETRNLLCVRYYEPAVSSVFASPPTLFATFQEMHHHGRSPRVASVLKSSTCSSTISRILMLVCKPFNMSFSLATSSSGGRGLPSMAIWFRKEEKS